jgi:hypothetical protein
MVPNIGLSHAIPISPSHHSQLLGKTKFAERPAAWHACLARPICSRDWPASLNRTAVAPEVKRD